MSFFERLFRKPDSSSDQGSYLDKEKPAPGLRVVVFEDDPNLRNLYRIYIRDILKGELLGMEAQSLDSYDLITRINQGLAPHAAIVDGNLRGSGIGFDNWKGAILRRSRADGLKLYTGHYVIYALDEIRRTQRRNLRLIGVSAFDLMEAPPAFQPDVSIVKSLDEEKTKRLFRELRYAATLPETY
jgi:hypothetical protein